MLAEQLRSRSDLVWAAFKARVQAQGGTVLEPEWLGNHKPHHVSCAEGHDGYIEPGNVQQGRGICKTCAGRDSAAAWQNFKASVEALGGIMLEPKWLGTDERHHVRCGNGHDAYPTPHYVQGGGGICSTCAGHNPAAAAMNFRAQLAELGATLLEPYVDCMHPHHVLCANNHDCFPRPNNVKSGQGICDQCAGRVHDVFYLVTGPRGLKVGVTSGDPKDRLRDHRRDGYYEDGDPDRLWIKLPPKVANETEDLVLASLKAAGIKPIERREYFGIEALPVVLSIVDRELAWYTPVFGPGQEEGIKETQ